MIITRTPYRISFFGGGTDYPAFFERHGGLCLSATIDRYCYIGLSELQPFLGHRYVVLWSKGMQGADRVDDIEHPSVRGCMQYLELDDGIEVRHMGDLPARSGLGSSSAFTVGMLRALHVMKGRAARKWELANDAIQVEQNVLRETVGVQDQIACACGGLNLIRIGKDSSYSIEHVQTSQDALAECLVLVWTGLQRYASEIAASQVDNVDRKEAELLNIMGLVDQARFSLAADDFHEFGRLLHETWMLKRELSPLVATAEIDEIYQSAMDYGIWGGKVLGAGGGGFMLFCLPPGRKEGLVEKLGLMSVPVKFEDHGSQLVLNA